jgi:hypothetical protein
MRKCFQRYWEIPISFGRKFKSISNPNMGIWLKNGNIMVRNPAGLRKKRNLFFFTPFKNYFRITFVFGARAVAEVEKSDLPDGIKETLKNARKYAEGRGLSVEVKSSEDIQIIIKLIAIKVDN